jgi:hypothetical protein
MTQLPRFALVLCALVVAGPVPAGEIQAYAGAVAGFASGGSGIFGCATSGPTIAAPWYSGIGLPTEGFAACNLAGGIDNKFANNGTLTASQSVTGPAVTGTFSGSAQARAAYWDLGVAVAGSNSGGSAPMVYRQTAAFAHFVVPLTLNSPGIASGTPGAVNFSFLVEGDMASDRNAPYTQQVDTYLGMRVNNTTIGPWTVFASTLVNEELPYVRGGATGLPGAFVLGPGSLSGSATVTTTGNFAMQWGVPFEVEVALYAQQSACCYGTTLSADFLGGAVLKGIQAFGPGGRLVTDFSGIDEAGNRLGATGVLSVPEPASALLMLVGLAAVGGVAVRRQRA